MHAYKHVSSNDQEYSTSCSTAKHRINSTVTLRVGRKQSQC